jgi:hypothetical protein
MVIRSAALVRALVTLMAVCGAAMSACRADVAAVRNPDNDAAMVARAVYSNIEGPTGYLDVGDTAHLELVLRDSTRAVIGRGRPFWSSEDPSVATVDSNGTVRAIGPGRIRIRAVLGRTSTWTDLEVIPTIASFSLRPSDVPLGSESFVRYVFKDKAGHELLYDATLTIADTTRATLRPVAYSREFQILTKTLGEVPVTAVVETVRGKQTLSASLRVSFPTIGTLVPNLLSVVLPSEPRG